MKITYNKDKSITLHVTESEYMAIYCSLVDMANRGNACVNMDVRPILDAMHRADEKRNY